MFDTDMKAQLLTPPLAEIYREPDFTIYITITCTQTTRKSAGFVLVKTGVFSEEKIAKSAFQISEAGQGLSACTKNS